MVCYIGDENYNWKGLTQRVFLEDDVWIGVVFIVLSGVTIGIENIIAAKFVVTNDVLLDSIYAGNPTIK